MMTIPVFVSFTSLLTKLDLDTAAQDNALFLLGCAERNAFVGTPFEIDWGEGEEINRGRLVRIREILLQGMRDGRVFFCKQPDPENPERFFRDDEQARCFLRAKTGLHELEFEHLNYPCVRDDLEPYGFKVLY